MLLKSRGQSRGEQAEMSTRSRGLTDAEIRGSAIAARNPRWYALNMMRCQVLPRVARLFCKNSYRCIHETIDQLQKR